MNANHGAVTCCLGHRESPERVWDLPEGQTLLRCSRCGLVFLERAPIVPSGLDLDEEYFDYYAAHPEDKMRFARSLLRKIERYATPPGRFLEVGASLGYLLVAARERGWTVEGIETSEHAAQYARERFHLSIRVASIDAAELPQETYDVVVLYHVLEHLADPPAVLKKLRASLRPSGRLILGVPNWNGMLRRLLGPRWPLLVPKDHRWHFTQKTLAALLKANGFEPIRIESETGFQRPALGFRPTPRMILNEILKTFYVFHWFGLGEALFAVAQRR